MGIKGAIKDVAGLTEPEAPLESPVESLGGPPPPWVPEWPGGGEDRPNPDRGGSRSNSIAGIILLMCVSTMTFGAMMAAMVFRRQLGNDWTHLGLPRILWWNTVALVLSSIAIDLGRRALRSNERAAFNRYWTAGAILGTIFLIGQVIGWRDLETRGFYLAGQPTTAFFYVITWAHAAHVVGALGAVLYVEYCALRFRLGPGRRTFVDVSAIFWHFLDAIWLCIMAIFVFWA